MEQSVARVKWAGMNVARRKVGWNGREMWETRVEVAVEAEPYGESDTVFEVCLLDVKKLFRRREGEFVDSEAWSIHFWRYYNFWINVMFILTLSTSVAIQGRDNMFEHYRDRANACHDDGQYQSHLSGLRAWITMSCSKGLISEAKSPGIAVSGSGDRVHGAQMDALSKPQDFARSGNLLTRAWNAALISSRTHEWLFPASSFASGAGPLCRKCSHMSVVIKSGRRLWTKCIAKAIRSAFSRLREILRTTSWTCQASIKMAVDFTHENDENCWNGRDKLHRQCCGKGAYALHHLYASISGNKISRDIKNGIERHHVFFIPECYIH